jgi:N-acetylmuramoyl-L-alanine amidase
MTVGHRRVLACRTRLRWARAVLATIAVGVVTSACGVSNGSDLAQTPPAAAASPVTAQPQVTHASPMASSASPTPSASATPLAGKVTLAGKAPLAGQIVGIDPGHNGHNYTDPAYLNHLIWNGRASEACDTTGTETNSGYTEALFNFRVATFLRADLIRDGAKVVMTRTNNVGVGPCVNTRSTIINHGHANVAVDIHADGGPPSGRGFAILEPIADGPNDKVITSSGRLGSDIRRAFLSGTSMPESTYDGVHGITHRNDLAGTNLTTVPKVLIECGNMRNATDAALLTSTPFQRKVARALEAAIIRFLS